MILYITLLSSCRSDTPDIVSPEETFARVCAACHGEKGEGKRELNSPSIAGLPEWYLHEQVEKFQNGFRGSHTEDIPGNQMKAIVLSLTGEQLQAAISDVAKLEPVLTRVAESGDVDKGRKLYAENCMICHKFNGEGMAEFHSAPLTSLNPEYILRQLRYYKKGWRGESWEDVYGHKMYRALDGLNDQALVDLVRYIGELAKGDDPRRVMER